jgi:hypothetical protein
MKVTVFWWCLLQAGARLLLPATARPSGPTIFPQDTLVPLHRSLAAIFSRGYPFRDK